MTYYKTTLFYEIQLNRLLAEIEDLDTAQIKKRLEAMLADPNTVELP